MYLLPVLALLVGCTTQDAEVTADYAIFLAAASSENLDRLDRNGTDVAESTGKLGLTPIDCRDLSYLEDEESIAAARLEGVDYAADCCEAGEGESCDGVLQPRYFGWLDDYAYYLNEGKVDAYRTEVVLTTEGDLQLTVHMDVPEFGDFRFGWVIDPQFQPELCVDQVLDEDGTLVALDEAQMVEDQGDWLGTWSAGEEKGTLWHLNAGSFQINPSNQAEAWYFDQDWSAGYTFSRFADEEFYGHAVDYSDEMYRPYHIDWYSDGTCSNATDDDGDGLTDDRDPDCEFGFEGTSIPEPRGVNPDERYNSWVEATTEFFANDVTDLATFGKSSFPLAMKLENNTGRPADGASSGLDGWLGVSPSWVRIDNPDAIGIGKPGTPITGEFQVYLEGVAAASKVFVHGTFSIDNVREDVWGYENGTLDAVKREENNTPECGDDRPSGPLAEGD